LIRTVAGSLGSANSSIVRANNGRSHAYALPVTSVVIGAWISIITGVFSRPGVLRGVAPLAGVRGVVLVVVEADPAD